MKTLRYIVCPCCGLSRSPKALDRQAFERFRVDIRLCNGRKGFPHVATEDLTPDERAQVRARLLGTIQAAVKEGVLSENDLVVLAGAVPSSDPRQVPLAIRTVVVTPIRAVEMNLARSAHIKPAKEV